MHLPSPNTHWNMIMLAFVTEYKQKTELNIDVTPKEQKWLTPSVEHIDVKDVHVSFPAHILAFYRFLLLCFPFFKCVFGGNMNPQDTSFEDVRFQLHPTTHTVKSLSALTNN